MRLSSVARVLIVVCFAVVALYACASDQFTSQGYQAGVVSKTSYDMALTGVADLYNKGLVGDDVKQKAIELGRIWKNTHNNAIEALAQYEEADPTNMEERERLREQYLLMVEQASSAMVDLLAFINPYLVKYGKGAIK